MTVETWTEDDSATFLDHGAYYVPEREEQVRTILELLSSQPPDLRAVELCPGAGILTAAILEAFPGASVLALDGSAAMRESTRRAAGPHADRLEVAAFDLLAEDWRDFGGRTVNAVVTSLAVHHLDGAGKARLFRDLHAALAPGGVFVLADLTEPPSGVGRAIAARAWDDEVRRRALAADGTLAAFEHFEADEWNYYTHVAPGADPVDKPSSLFDQLRWLDEAGFADVDAHWMKAGHVIISGWKR